MLCVHAYVLVCAGVSVYVHTYVLVCMCMCVSVCVHMCMCVFKSAFSFCFINNYDSGMATQEGPSGHVRTTAPEGPPGTAMLYVLPEKKLKLGELSVSISDIEEILPSVMGLEFHPLTVDPKGTATGIAKGYLSMTSRYLISRWE